MNEIIDIDGESIRDSVDAKDRFELFRQARLQAQHSYGGSMKFERRGEYEYLIRRPYGRTTRNSLGRRGPETEQILRDFVAGKAQSEEQVLSLRRQLEERAPILRARGLGRVPLIAARILRKLDDLGWLGTSLIVLGTNALFAYESRAAVRVEPGLLAAGGVNVLHDVRRRLDVSGSLSKKGLLAILQSVDRSFRPATKRALSAVNKDGYVVNLIEPRVLGPNMSEEQAGQIVHPADPTSAQVDSGGCLFGVQEFEATVFDQRGLPLRIVTVDPRVFAMQKKWIVENDPSHDPARRVRDLLQARVAAAIATRHLGLSFDDPALSALPRSFRDFSRQWPDATPGFEAEW